MTINNRSMIFANRLKSLRTTKGLKQADFCKDFSVFCGRDTKLPISTLSSWELGTKRPPYETLISLSDFFGVSVDYLIGKDSTENTSRELQQLFLEDFVITIDRNKLNEYDQKPVFIVFGDNIKYGRWGIYNKKLDCFCCAKERIRNSENLKYYAATEDTFPQPKRISAKR